MAHEHLETEVKLIVPDLNVVAERLQRAGVQPLRARVYERNIRYENAGKSLLASGIVLRLRQDERARLTYKEPSPGGAGAGIRTHFEAEVEVSDFDTTHLILAKLGFHRHMVYEKYRTTYALEGAEVVLDELPYGNFVEIEGSVTAIERVAARLELAGAPRLMHSYSALFEIVRRNLGLDFTDLTFANFTGIRVTEESFSP